MTNRVIDLYESIVKNQEHSERLTSVDKIRQENVQWILDEFDENLAINYNNLWVIVQREEPRVVQATEMLWDVLNNLRVQQKLTPGTVIVMARFFASIDPSVTSAPLILTVDDLSLKGFLS